MPNTCTDANRGNVGFGWGGSNMAGSNTGAPARAKPSWLTLYTNKSGTFQLESAYPTNPGIYVGMVMELEDAGFEGPMTLAIYGEPGSSILTWNTTYMALALAELASAGIRPNFSFSFVGSVDGQSGTNSANAGTNMQGCGQKIRTQFGAGTGLIIGGPHTPEDVSEENLDTIDAGLMAYVGQHGARLAAYIRNREAEIQGGGNDHLTGGATGGSVTVGRSIGRMVLDSRLLVW